MKLDRNRKLFVHSIRHMLNDSDDVEDSDEQIKDMDSDEYHDNDEDLIQYAKQYKTKVAAYHVDRKPVHPKRHQQTLRVPRKSLRTVDRQRAVDTEPPERAVLQTRESERPQAPERPRDAREHHRRGRQAEPPRRDPPDQVAPAHQRHESASVRAAR